MVDCVSAWVIHLCLQFNTASGFSVVTLICCPWTKSFRIIIHKLTYRRRPGPTCASWDIWRASNTRPLRLFCTHCVDISTNREHQAKPVKCFSTLAHRQILFHRSRPEPHSNINVLFLRKESRGLLFCDCTDCACTNHMWWHVTSLTLHSFEWLTICPQLKPCQGPAGEVHLIPWHSDFSNKECERSLKLAVKGN